MRKFIGLKVITPVLAGLLVGTSGCSDAASDLGCSAEISASVDKLQVSVKAMTDLSAELRASVGTACKNIAVAGGTMVTVSAAPTDAEVKTACDAANAAITASASGSLNFEK